jgi:hypothetical protein
MMTPTINDDPAFSSPIRTKGPLRRFTRTVGPAIDTINDDLPDDKKELEHWRLARHLLYEASNHPKDEYGLKLAEAAFRSALKKERWLL